MALRERDLYRRMHHGSWLMIYIRVQRKSVRRLEVAWFGSFCRRMAQKTVRDRERSWGNVDIDSTTIAQHAVMLRRL